VIQAEQKLVQIQVKILDFIQFINVGDITPGVGESLFLSFGIVQVDGFEKDIIRPFRVERGVDVNQVDAFILDGSA